MTASHAPRPRHRRAAVILASGLLALGAPGCGGSTDSPADSSADNGITQDSPQEILNAAKEAASKANSVTIQGTSSLSLRQLIKTTVDLKLTRTGGQGTIELIGIKFQVIGSKDAIYVKGSEQLYRRLHMRKPRSPDTWLKLSASSELAAYTDLAGETNRVISTGGDTTKGATTTVEGQPVIELKTEGKLYNGRLYIKTTGEPYPVKLEKHGRENATFTFTKWNGTPPAATPTNTAFPIS